MPPPASICIVRLSALGDVIMILPLIKMLRLEWPHIKITWVIRNTFLPAVAFLEKEGVEFVAIEKPRGIRDFLAFRRRMADRQFDALLCVQTSLSANLLGLFIRARRKIGCGPDRARILHSLVINETLPHTPPHTLDGFLQFGEALGISRKNSDHEGAWGLEIAPEAVEWAAQTLPKTPWLAVVPCSTNVLRDWPPESCAQVITHAWNAHKMPSVFLGGASKREKPATGAIRRALPASVPVLDLVGKTDIPRLVAAIAQCAVLFSPDTGPVHIARALARPAVGLYAVAPSSRTGPYRKMEYCVDKYDEALRLIAGKNRVEVPWSRRVRDARAMRLITPDEVCAQLDRAILQPATL